MYETSKDAVVTERRDVPQSSVGAPCPMVLADEHHLHLAYYLEPPADGWDGSTVRMVGESTRGEPCALVRFSGACAHMFGPPNDEAFSSHPLYSRGLRPYAVFEARPSPWIRQLERMNSVHPDHRPERFDSFTHFVFSFHDTTFECVAERFEISVHRGSVHEVLAAALASCE